VTQAIIYNVIIKTIDLNTQQKDRVKARMSDTVVISLSKRRMDASYAPTFNLWAGNKKLLCGANKNGFPNRISMPLT